MVEPRMMLIPLPYVLELLDAMDSTLDNGRGALFLDIKAEFPNTLDSIVAKYTDQYIGGSRDTISSLRDKIQADVLGSLDEERGHDHDG